MKIFKRFKSWFKSGRASYLEYEKVKSTLWKSLPKPVRRQITFHTFYPIFIFYFVLIIIIIILLNIFI